MKLCISQATIFRGPLLVAGLLSLSEGCATKVIFHDHTHHQAGEGGEGAEAAAPTSGRGGATNSNGGASATAGNAGTVAQSNGGSSSGGLGGESEQGAGRANGGASGRPIQIGESGQGGTSGEGGDSGAGNNDPLCGNGVLDAGEACDDGKNNGPGRSCNASCRKNACGDGDKGPAEGCDDGDANGLALLACAPDCSRIIERKHIIVSSEVQNETLQPNPVARADAQCPDGFKALFGYADVRRATTTAFANRNAIDWVLQPYTYYVNNTENLIWLTREVPLLGVDGGTFVGLVNPISAATNAIVSNLNPDGTLLLTDNCDGWSGADTHYSKHVGLPPLLDAGFLDYDLFPCGYSVNFYCVEQ